VPSPDRPSNALVLYHSPNHLDPTLLEPPSNLSSVPANEGNQGDYELPLLTTVLHICLLGTFQQDLNLFSAGYPYSSKPIMMVVPLKTLEATHMVFRTIMFTAVLLTMWGLLHMSWCYKIRMFLVRRFCKSMI
jgi:hypothetical protein